MTTPSLAIQLLAGLGLATGSGLNAWIPVLGVSVAARADWIDLSSSMSWMSSNIAIGAFALLLIADFVGDKVPAVDSVVHTIGLVVHPVVGGAVLMAQTNLLGDVHPALGWITGGALGGGVHLARMTLRPAVTAASVGTGNWLVSALEDAMSLAITIFAIVVPIIGFILAVTIAWMVIRRVQRRRRTSPEDGGPSPTIARSGA